MKFRLLHADEIDCRVSSINDKGLSLLLYKDARVDQNILDETVGEMNWQRHHTRDNANCIVSIWDESKKQWIEKEDTGSESNTQAEKGLASDSFKRACFNWGIGRELYTSPFIWIKATDCNIKKNGERYACYDKFTVKSIDYTDGAISQLEIVNAGKVVFSLGKKVALEKIDKVRKLADLADFYKDHEDKKKMLLEHYGIKELRELDDAAIENTWEKIKK